MKKYHLFAHCLIIIISLAVVSCQNRNPYQEEQEALANLLGVEIQDYAYDSSFPLSYYAVVLETGTPINKVHEIVRGYEKVYHCQSYSEIYYYFSTEDDKALRFVIMYDEQLKISKIYGEDSDSRYIKTEDCDLEQLPEK
jgi:hypothetical protein